MKKLLFVIVLLVIIGLTLMMTCPDKDVHYEALKGVTSEVINAEMNESKIEETMASIGTVLAVNVVDAYLKSNLIVRDRTFYNVGVITYKGDFRMVSVGVFNHVYTIDKETAREIIKDKISLNEIIGSE
jgi:hypothetical protein